MIEENDEGDYSCKISNSDGIEISKCQIEIERPKSRMESSLKSHNDQTNNTRSLAQKFGFLKHVQSQNLIQGEQLILECSVYGDHPLDLIWLRNGKEIPENPDFIRETNGNNYKLTVKEVFPEDSGVFSAELFCATSNQAVMSACSIIIQGKDNDLINNDLKFIQFPISYNLDEGSSIKLDCKIKSNLQQQQQSIKVKWFKNNEEIIESDRIKFINDNNNHLYSLNITTVLSTDDGQYYVVATNTTNGEEITAAFCLIVSFEINDSNLIDVKKILEKSIEHK